MNKCVLIGYLKEPVECYIFEKNGNEYILKIVGRFNKIKVNSKKYEIIEFEKPIKDYKKKSYFLNTYRGSRRIIYSGDKIIKIKNQLENTYISIRKSDYIYKFIESECCEPSSIKMSISLRAIKFIKDKGMEYDFLGKTISGIKEVNCFKELVECVCESKRMYLPKDDLVFNCKKIGYLKKYKKNGKTFNLYTMSKYWNCDQKERNTKNLPKDARLT